MRLTQPAPCGLIQLVKTMPKGFTKIPTRVNMYEITHEDGRTTLCFLAEIVSQEPGAEVYKMALEFRVNKGSDVPIFDNVVEFVNSGRNTVRKLWNLSTDLKLVDPENDTIEIIGSHMKRWFIKARSGEITMAFSTEGQPGLFREYISNPDGRGLPVLQNDLIGTVDEIRPLHLESHFSAIAKTGSDSGDDGQPSPRFDPILELGELHTKLGNTIEKMKG